MESTLSSLIQGGILISVLWSRETNGRIQRKEESEAERREAGNPKECGGGRGGKMALSSCCCQPDLFPGALGAVPVPALSNSDTAFRRLCSQATGSDSCPCRFLKCHPWKQHFHLPGAHTLCLWLSGHLVPFSQLPKIGHRWVTIVSTLWCEKS